MNSNPSPMLDLARSDAETADHLLDYFRAKSGKDPVASHAFFSDDALTYTDAPLGWVTRGKAGISEAFTSVMPHWGDADWDSSGIDDAFHEQVRAPAESVPDTFGEEQLTPVELGAVEVVATSVQQAVGAGDPAGAADLFDYDATWDDRCLGVRIVGKPSSGTSNEA